MTKAEIYSELQEWERVQKGLDAQIAKLKELSEFNTVAVEQLVGDKGGALRWWQLHCEYGANPLSAGKGDKIRPIKTLKQLAGLISE